MSEVILRSATESDLPVLTAFRGQMFRDMGWTDEERLEQLAPRYEAYLRERWGVGEFASWIAEQDGQAVGAVSVLWERVPPTVRNLSGRQAYILGLYVVPSGRRQGIARRLLESALTYARDEGADVVALHYSPAGRGLYEQLGFVESPEMRLFTDAASASWSPGAPAHTAADDAD